MDSQVLQVSIPRESPVMSTLPLPVKPAISIKMYMVFFIALAVIEAGITYSIYAYKHNTQLAISQTNSSASSPETPGVNSLFSTSSANLPLVPSQLTGTPTRIPTPSTTLMPTTSPVSGPPKNGYSHITIKTDRGNFVIDVASILMTSGSRRVSMIVDSANDTDCINNCPTKPLGDYVKAYGGFAGINGTYFCPSDYAECAGKTNSYDFPIYNTRIDDWINPQNIAWNDRALLYKNYDGLHFYRRAKDAWKLVSTNVDVEAALVSAPGLLDNGSVIVDNYPLSDKQKAKGTKSGIGFVGNITYLVVAQNADMSDLAYIFKAIGAGYAMNLDAGGSTALWFGGYIVGPGRSLPNAIIFSLN